MANETNSTRTSGVRHGAHDRVDKIMDKAENINERSKEKLSHIKEKASMMKEDIDGYIRQNPEKSVLIAAGIGAVIGAMFAAAMMRRKQ